MYPLPEHRLSGHYIMILRKLKDFPAPNFVVFREANISVDKMKAIKEYFRTKKASGPRGNRLDGSPVRAYAVKRN
jgi:hypothetical protein